jgi:hypothetical protein
MSERNVVFEDDKDITFMGLNIFSHDFLHDFHAENMRKRLSKISSDIDKLRTAIESHTQTGGDKRKLDEYNNNQGNNINVDETNINENVNIEEIEMENIIQEENVTVQSDEDFTDYISLDIREIEETIFDIEYLFESLDLLINRNGVVTRSRANLIENIQNFISESKLYVIGMMGNTGQQFVSSTTGGTTMVRENQGLPSNLFMNPVQGNYFNQMPVASLTSRIANNNGSPSSSESNSNSESSVTVNEFDEGFFKIVEDGFSNVIYDQDVMNDIYFQNYFITMRKLYFFLKNKNTSPLDTFNNDYIEYVLLLYLLNKGELNDTQIEEILTGFTRKQGQEQGQEQGQGQEQEQGQGQGQGQGQEQGQGQGQVGGETEDEINTISSFMNTIEESFPLLFHYYDASFNIISQFPDDDNIINQYYTSIQYLKSDRLPQNIIKYLNKRKLDNAFTSLVNSYSYYGKLREGDRKKK